MSLHFEWDKEKATLNIRNHRVSFDEASSVFDDPLARIFDDEDHSLDEHREIIIGHSVLNHLLLVSFIERAEAVIRIISARLVTKQERKIYEQNTSFQ